MLCIVFFHGLNTHLYHKIFATTFEKYIDYYIKIICTYNYAFKLLLLLLLHFGQNKLTIDFDICSSKIRDNTATKTRDDPIIWKGSGNVLVKITLITHATIISVDLKVDTVAGGIIWRDLNPKKNPIIPATITLDALLYLFINLIDRNLCVYINWWYN